MDRIIRKSDKVTREEYFMNEAIAEAKKAYALKETPIGAVVVYEDKIVGRGFNKIEISKDPINHAEIVAIKDAANNLDRWRLFNCEIYITMEPCFMCTGAIVNSRIKKVYIGARHLKNGKVDKHNNFQREYLEDCKVESIYGIKEEECSKILSAFFKERRKEKANKAKLKSEK